VIALIPSRGVHTGGDGDKDRGGLLLHSRLAFSSHTAAPGPAGRAVRCTCVRAWSLIEGEIGCARGGRG
jgi:hypothetical protein